MSLLAAPTSAPYDFSDPVMYFLVAVFLGFAYYIYKSEEGMDGRVWGFIFLAAASVFIFKCTEGPNRRLPSIYSSLSHSVTVKPTVPEDILC